MNKGWGDQVDASREKMQWSFCLPVLSPKPSFSLQRVGHGKVLPDKVLLTLGLAWIFLV